MDKKALFARLAEGHAAGITVVTPNTRLAQALVSEFDSYQIARNKTSWEAADILPFDALVQRLYEDALYSDIQAPLPMLLTPAQEESLWRQAIDKAELLSPAETAARCRDAWRLMHAWRIKPARSNDDTAAFLAWASSYEKKTVSDTDSARLPDLVLTHLKDLKRPKLLVAYGFGVLPAQTREFLEAFDSIQVFPEKKPARASRASFASEKEELEKAAQWARARLENRGQAPISPRIGVVVPDLKRRRKEVLRVFSRVLRPGYNLPGTPRAPLPFNVSLGLSLDRYPVVALALSVLKFSREELPFEEASELIRSPFIAGAEKELAARARLDAALRRQLEATVSLPKLIGVLEKKSLLREKLERLFGLRDDGLFADKLPSEWARHFSALLDTVGFPGERALDSEEFQARNKWHEVLGEFAKLDRVSKQISHQQALGLLRRLCSDTLFQPESPDTPIQVLEVLESTGLEFDHLWVCGLSDEAWPRHANPNPFLPVAAQRAAGVDEASAEGALARDKRITEGWLAAADEVVFSWFEKEEDRKLEPSPLVLGVAKKDVEIPAFPDLRSLIFSSAKLERIEDRVAPPVTALQVRGGTRVLADQSACPFRAFVHHRLRAQELEQPVDGLDARDRGTLVHHLMARLWTLLKDSSSLERDLSPAIDDAAAFAVKELGLEGRFAELERARMARLAREWLEQVERKRKDFEVVAVEKDIAFKVAGLEFKGRIDRMDRIDGGHVVIDYKTSRNLTPNQWKVPRPEDPQLPLYALNAGESLAAVAFGKVRPGEMRYMGFARAKDMIPQVQASKNWKAQLDGWKEEAESLGRAFAAGEARVDPKRELQTCRYCDLHTLCRVYEKVNPLKEDEGMEGTGE